MTKTAHDLLAWRLAAILQKLNRGERLHIDQLAEEFNVHRHSATTLSPSDKRV